MPGSCSRGNEMTRGSIPSALVSRAFGLCEQIRGLAALEKDRAGIEADEFDEYKSPFENGIETTVQELVDLLDGAAASGTDAKSVESLKVEIGFTLVSIEDAIRTVGEARKTVRDLLNESRARREAVRAYDIIHAS